MAAAGFWYCLWRMDGSDARYYRMQMPAGGPARGWAIAWQATGGLTIRRRLPICPTHRRGARGGTGGGGLGRISCTSVAIKARNKITSRACGTSARQAD